MWPLMLQPLLYTTTVVPLAHANVSLPIVCEVASHYLIKRLLRWRGDESLELYARLNDGEWRAHVFSTYGAVVDSTIAGRLAALGHFDFEQVAPTIAQVNL